MSEDESLRKGNKAGAPAPADAGADSLDFTQAAPAASPAPPPVDHATPLRRASSRKRSPAAVPAQAAPQRTRSIAIPLLIAAAIGVAAYVVSDRSAQAPTPPTAKAPAPLPPPAYKAPQTPAPAAKAPASPPAPADAPSVGPPALPAEFLQLFQTYSAKPAPKAIALALDPNGRWAYGSIAGYSTQAGANEEALSECARFKAQSDIKEKCRLYAVGDKVVW